MAMPPESIRVLLIDGPFDRETRIIRSVNGGGEPPDVIRIHNPIDTFATIADALTYEQVVFFPSYCYYIRDFGQKEVKGTWHYQFRPSMRKS